MATNSTAGYSGTPLARKLGIKENTVVVTIGAPRDYRRLLEPLPTGVDLAGKDGAHADIVHVFTAKASVLGQELTRLRKNIRPDAAIWVSWPKKAAKVPTDITENTIREIALPLGLVDIKVCAVSEVWSGLKLVIRKQLRS